jgi:hypothetical protein
VTSYGWIGVWLLVGAVVAIVIEGVLAAVWALAVGRRTRVLAELLQSEQAMLDDDVRRLRLALEEMERLWRPYGRTLRWLRHPIAIALMQSYARRRAL